MFFNLISDQCSQPFLKFIQGGAQEICHRLLNKISKENLRLSDPVIHIQRTEDYVIVETENEIYKFVTLKETYLSSNKSFQL